MSVSQATANRGERVAKMSMIVPTETLVKYDNPTLVSKNTDKRTKVSITNSQFLILSAKKNNCLKLANGPAADSIDQCMKLVHLRD